MVGSRIIEWNEMSKENQKKMNELWDEESVLIKQKREIKERMMTIAKEKKKIRKKYEE